MHVHAGMNSIVNVLMYAFCLRLLEVRKIKEFNTRERGIESEGERERKYGISFFQG